MVESKKFEGAETTESMPETAEIVMPTLDPKDYPDPNSIAAQLVVRGKMFTALLKSQAWQDEVKNNETQANPLTIVILGPSGAGKSTTTNHLLENMKERAAEGNGQNSCTKDCSRYTGTLCGRKVNLIDTPGFNDTHGLSDETIMAQILAEVCLNTDSKTVDAFLVTDSLKADKSYSDKVITVLKKCFGDDAARKVIILMTKGELEIQDDVEVDKIDERVKHLENILKKHGAYAGSLIYWTNEVEGKNGVAGKGCKVHGLQKRSDV